VDGSNPVATSRAKAKISHWLSFQQKQRATEIGRRLLEKELRRYKVNLKKAAESPEMAAYLSERLGRDVKLVPSKNPEAFWKDVTEQRYDIVHYNQYHYIRSAQFYRVVAHQQEFGQKAVAGALFVRADSGITNLKQLRGRRVMFGGGRDAMMSYIAPRYLLMQAGLGEAQFKTEFAVNPPNALLALYHRQADAAGAVHAQSVVRQRAGPSQARQVRRQPGPSRRDSPSPQRRRSRRGPGRRPAGEPPPPSSRGTGRRERG
jgi:hypothetical protein